jgi:hypothetical protein
VSVATEACGLRAQPGDCRACVAAHCCDEAAACAQDPACSAVESCLLECGSDYACRARCSLDNAASQQTDVPRLDTCVAANCNDACGLTCGMSTAFTTPDSAPTCERCLNENCGATLACTTSLDCQLAGHCVASCFSPDCRGACLQGDGGALFVSQALSAGLHCLAPCDIGELWQCIGKVSWPLAQSGPSDVTLTLLDQQQGGPPMQGILVKACPPGTDRQCLHPLSTGTTGADGKVTLTLLPVQSPGYGFWGYFDLTLPAPPPGALHYLYFLSFPLSVEHAALSLSIYSATAFANLLSIPAFKPDPARGYLQVTATDCLTIPAPNVTFVAHGIDDMTHEVYLQGGLLNAAATATDRLGTVFFLNAPAAPIRVDATPIPLGGVVSSTVNVFVRAGALSIVQAIPTQM